MTLRTVVKKRPCGKDMNTFALATVLELEEQEKQLEEQVMRRLISQSIFPRQSYHTMSSADLHRRVMTSRKLTSVLDRCAPSSGATHEIVAKDD